MRQKKEKLKSDRSERKCIRCVLWALLLLTVLLLFAGCGFSSGSGDPASLRDASTLVYGSGDYTRINPAMDEHCEINLLLFNGLTSHGEDNEVIPCLAKSWEFDRSTCTYTFHLEEDVTWHDGEPFTADDVKFTIEAIMDPANGSENAPNYEDVEEISVILSLSDFPPPMRPFWTT